MAVAASYLTHLPTDELVTDGNVLRAVVEVIKRRHEYRERQELETDPTWRQPIPYVLVTTPVPDTRYVAMTRMQGQGETRLAGKKYIGAGGHVEEGHTIFYTALLEVTQELGVPLKSLELDGVLITTGGPVEDVHLCMFYRATTTYTNFTSPERDLHLAHWATREELGKDFKDMEKWSQVIARDYLNIKG